MSSFIVICLMALFAAPFTSSVLATVTSQFSLNPSTAQSPCWLKCHVALTSQVLAAPPGVPNGVGGNDPTLLSANCRWETYRTTLSRCLIQECSLTPSSYDIAYAAEYASIVCRKAGVEGFVVDVPASVTSQVGGYYATATPEDLVALSKRSSATPSIVLHSSRMALLLVVASALVILAVTSATTLF